MRCTRWLAVLALALAASHAQAQYPTKPIRIIVPFPAGGGADDATRIVAQSLTLALGQPVIVDNKPGADGQIAAMEVKRAAADGYTIFAASGGAMSAVPALRKAPPYDPLRDFTPISTFFSSSNIILVHPDVPARSLAELIDYARGNPGKLSYGSGTAYGIVAMAQLQQQTRTSMVHVPYKGEGPAVLDLLAGRIQVLVASPVPTLGHIKEGKLRALATTLPQRISLLPDVPTYAEAGFPVPRFAAWMGFVGPAKLPRDVSERLSREITLALKREEVREQLARTGSVASGSSPEGMAEFMREQLGAWRQGIRDAGIPQE